MNIALPYLSKFFAAILIPLLELFNSVPSAKYAEKYFGSVGGKETSDGPERM